MHPGLVAGGTVPRLRPLILMPPPGVLPGGATRTNERTVK
nr:MAG TPA: hypothetical protein [Caudoviricetes sp.]